MRSQTKYKASDLGGDGPDRPRKPAGLINDNPSENMIIDSDHTMTRKKAASPPILTIMLPYEAMDCSICEQQAEERHSLSTIKHVIEHVMGHHSDIIKKFSMLQL
jgi:hypothetical protein